MNKFYLVCLFLSLLMGLSCCNSYGQHKPNLLEKSKIELLPQDIGLITGKSYVISQDIDLQGRRCIIPPNVSLVFKGGKFKNGELHGQNTKIDYSGVVFDKVLISGSWICPVIKSSMFADLSYGNSLKDVIALVNPNIHNKVIINEGKYILVALKPTDSCLPVLGNTELVINGTIELAPNEYGKYYMIHVMGDDVVVRGKGELIGDRPRHMGKEGQWGFGIYVNKAHHVRICDLSIRDCWGDCIYIGGKSTDVVIDNCNLSYGRRQGISITSAGDVLIKNCHISNVAGTAPEYGIDVEPNQNDTVRNVKIRNVVIDDCIGGIMAYGNAEGAVISNVDIKNCIMYASKKIPLRFIGCQKAKAINCQLTGSANLESVLCKDVENAIVKRNHFYYISLKDEGVKGVIKRIIRKKETERINLQNCVNTIVSPNWVGE